MIEIRKINPLSAGKISGLLCAGFHMLIGMVYIILVALVFFINLLVSNGESSWDLIITLLGGVVIIVLGGALGFLIGYVMGYLLAVMYNWITEYTGGLRFELSGGHNVAVQDVKKPIAVKVAPAKKTPPVKKPAIKKGKKLPKSSPPKK